MVTRVRATTHLIVPEVVLPSCWVWQLNWRRRWVILIFRIFSLHGMESFSSIIDYMRDYGPANVLLLSVRKVKNAQCNGYTSNGKCQLLCKHACSRRAGTRCVLSGYNCDHIIMLIRQFLTDNVCFNYVMVTSITSYYHGLSIGLEREEDFKLYVASQ